MASFYEYNKENQEYGKVMDVLTDLKNLKNLAFVGSQFNDCF